MWNEEAGAEKCVRAVVAALEGFPERNALLVVNDGSVDSTGAILERLKREYDRLVTVSHAQNAGYGGAIRTAIIEAARLGFTYVLFMDSDLTNDPMYIGAFVEKMREGVDVIKGSRYVSGGRAVGVPRYRVLISIIGNTVSRFLYGLPVADCTNGFRAVKVDVLRRMPLVETNFAIIMEELYYSRFLASSFAEVPYTLTARTDTVRKSSFYYRPGVFLQYLKYPVKSFLRIAPAARQVGEMNAAHDLSRV
jgi:dolichol-phosphate mannosyltransferase